MNKYELTPEHAALLPVYRDKWIKNAFATGRMDAETVEKVKDAIEAIYRTAKLDPPPRHRIVIAPSPFSARFAAGYAAAIWWMRDNPKSKLATGDATRAATWAATRDATGAATGAAKQDWSKWFQMEENPAEGATELMLKCAENASNIQQWGNQDAGYLSFYNFFREVAKLPIDWEKWIPWEYVSTVSGFRFMHPKFCIISELPVEFHINDQNQGHNENGPYVRWADGSRMYMINGVRVPAWLCEFPEALTLEKIEAEENAEVRSIMIERFGPQKYMEETGAECIDYSAGLGLVGSAPRALYKTKSGQKWLVGSDGSTKKIFWMPVPDEAKTCAQAHCLIAGVDNESGLIAEA